MVRRLGVALAVATAVAATTSCADNKLTSTGITCPSVILDRTTSSLTQIHDKMGESDTGNKTLKVDISGYNRTCKRTPTDLTMTLTVHFIATRGSSLTETTVVTWPYFIAAVKRILPVKVGVGQTIDKLVNPQQNTNISIGTADPTEILAKEIFPVVSTFPIGFNSIHIRDSELTIALPLLDKATPSYYQIFIGLQLTREQLEYNKKQITGNAEQKNNILKSM